MRQQQRQQLSAFIETKRRTRRRAVRATSLELGPPDSQRHFTPESHELSEEQCRQANALLRRAEQERPLRGDPQQVRFRHALRCAGIVSAVKRGVVGQTRFGHHLMGYRGGRMLAMHALAHLRAWSPIASLAAMMARERKSAQEHYEATGQVLAPGEHPAPSKEAQRIQDLQQLWEVAQWTQQAEHLRW